VKQAAFLLLVIIVCCAQACLPTGVSHPVPWYISRDDVSNLPTGNATTSDYNGRLYQFVSRSVDSCECTPDSVNYTSPCSAFTFEGDEGSYYEVFQEGSSIQFRMLVIDEATGGLVDAPAAVQGGFAVAPGAMNEDGTFLIGSVGLVWDRATGATLGEQFMLHSGEFVGDYMFIDSTQHAMARKGDLLNDCQFEVSRSFVWAPWPQGFSVVANRPASVQAGQTVNLAALVENASGKTSFSWLLTAIGTRGSVSRTHASSQTAVAVFSGDAEGTFSFEVTVRDSAGHSGSDTINIVVQ